MNDNKNESPQRLAPPDGHPSEYSPGSKWLSIGGWMRTGIIMAVDVCRHHSHVATPSMVTLQHVPVLRAMKVVVYMRTV